MTDSQIDEVGFSFHLYLLKERADIFIGFSLRQHNPLSVISGCPRISPSCCVTRSVRMANGWMDELANCLRLERGLLRRRMRFSASALEERDGQLIVTILFLYFFR